LHPTATNICCQAVQHAMWRISSSEPPNQFTDRDHTLLFVTTPATELVRLFNFNDRFPCPSNAQSLARHLLDIYRIRLQALCLLR